MIRDLWLRFKRFVLPYPLAFIGKYSVRLLLMTCKIKVKGLPEFKAAAANGGCIMMLWHSRIALTCEFFQKYACEIPYTAFLSKSRDGEPIARLLQSYPNSSAIRVAHDMRHGALLEVVQRLKGSRDLVLITPDGPRGPREKVKEGIVLAARAANAKIIPFTWEANKYWQFKTWDRFRMPRPFSCITIALGEALSLPAESAATDAAEYLAEALAALEKSAIKF
jgi:lysophospholipid acyltransferase (LPLAT)-like uncharacterized protein